MVTTKGGNHEWTNDGNPGRPLEENINMDKWEESLMLYLDRVLGPAPEPPFWFRLKKLDKWEERAAARCDHTLRIAKQWCNDNGVTFETSPETGFAIIGSKELPADCDCQLYLNWPEDA